MKKHRFLFSALMAIVMMAMSPAKAWAEDVTIGDGSMATWNWPYCSWYKAGSSVMYYTSAELRGGTISSIAFRVSNAWSFATNFVKVYMADTDITSLTTALDVTSVSFTEVYSGNPTLGTAYGWEPLALTTSFNHNKHKNLLVAVCRSSDKTGDPTYYYHNTGTSNNQSLYRAGDDASYADITNSTNSYSAWGNSRPDTRFTFAPCTTHVATHHARVESDCATNGNVEYWQCNVCGANFSDESCTNELNDISLPLSTTHASTTYHEAVAPDCTTDGTVEYWQCNVCSKYFSDENCTNELADIVDRKLGHNLDAEKHCSRCGLTITQLEGTELDISSKDMPIDIYSTYVKYADGTRIDNTGNLILTGTPRASTCFYIYGNPADGQIVLRDLDFTRNGPLFFIANSPEIANIYVEGNVTLNSTDGGVFYQYCSTPKVSITGPGNLTMTANGNSHVLSGLTSLDIDIFGDLVMSGRMSSSSSSLLNANANTITISQLTSEPFVNMSNTTLHAKGDIVVDCNGTGGYDYTEDNQVYLFQGLSSTEGTVRFRAAIGTDMEYCAVKVGDPVPTPSSSAPFAAYTKKIVHTNGFATYYNTLPSGTGTLTYNGNRPYLTLTKDLAGNTVFDMDVFKSASIEIYDGYLTNAELRSCWDGHPVFTGTATEARFLKFNETLSAANTPILRELTLNVSSYCLSGSNVVATIEGNVSMSGSGDAINATNSCTITGNGSLTLSGTNYIYGCPDMNIDITGDLVGSTTSSSASLNKHSFDFSKLHANSITFRGQAGSATEHAIIMPTPATTPAASDPSITYIVKGEHKDGYTIWFADYETLASCSETVVPTFDSLEELIAADQSYDAVNVTIEDKVLMALLFEGIYMVRLKNSEITLSAPGSDLGWASGSTVTGTLTNVAWNNTDKRLSGKDADFWSGLTCTAPSADNVPTFNSIEELLAAGIESSTTVTVTINGTIAEAKYVPEISAYQVKLDNGFVLAGMFCVTSDPEWEVGGTVSGTLENVTFINENGEPGIMCMDRNIFAPGAGLDYTAPVVPAVTIGETKIAITLNSEGKYETTEDIVLTDDAAFTANVDFIAQSVSYTRVMGSSTSKWGTIMLPFEVSSDEKVQYYDVTEVNLTEGVMTATPVETVTAGHPCLFKRLDEGDLTAGSSEEILISKSTTNGNISSSWTLVGTYSAITLDATATSDDYYYISADKFWHAIGTVDVKPYRAYFIGEAPTSSARALSIVVEEDGTSSIEAVMDVDGNIYDASEDAFDLSGRRISEGQRGLQIKNGRVVMMK